MLKFNNSLINVCRLIMLVIIFIGMLSGCKSTSSQDYNVSRINTILYNVRRAFNEHDIDTLMSHIHLNYLHKGQSRWAIREVWLNRMSNYQIIDFLNVAIFVDGNSARVEFTMKLQNADETVYTNEPNQNGDLSFFIYDNYDWSVYGNQFYYKLNETKPIH